MKGLVKTTFTLLVLAAAAISSQAQLPPPPGGPPTGPRPFFNRPGAGTNASRLGTNGAPVTTFPRTTTTGAAGPGPTSPITGPTGPGAIAPGTTLVSPRGNTNVVPKGLSNSIPAGMIQFQETDLSQVFEFYADLTGKTILRSPQVPPNVKISLRNKTDLTLEEGVNALTTMLGLNGVVMVPEGDKFVKAVPAASAGPEAPRFSTNAIADLPESKQIVAQVVQLKNMTPEEITGIIQPFANLANSIIAVKGSPVLILRDYAENVKRMLELIEKIDIAYPVNIETVVIPIKYALASDVAQVLSGLSSGGSSMTFGSSGGGPLQGGGMGGGLGGGLGGGMGANRGLGSSGFGNTGLGNTGFGNTGVGSTGFGSTGARPFGTTGTGTGVGAQNYGTSRSGFGSRLNSAVNRAIGSAGSGSASGDIQLIGQAKIIADERSNALLVFADSHDLPTITNIISKLDVVLPQVLIEALIMEVNLGSGRQLGVSMSQNRQDMGKLSTVGASQNGSFIDPTTIAGSFLGGGGTNASSGSAPSGFSYFGKYGKDFDFALTAAENDSRINVLSRPRIQTSTAQSAQIFVGEQRPFITGSYFSDFGGAGSRSQYSLQDIGISLSVQPIINQEGLVTMTVMQDISQVGGTTKIDNNDVPITIHRTANAYVSVHDRDTIILGGFISTTKNKSASGVPFLKDIPGLGMLFRSSSENIQRVELVVLIRPTVLPTPEAAALTAAREQESLPNIRRARREEDEFNQKQQDKALREEQKYERGKY